MAESLGFEPRCPLAATYAFPMRRVRPLRHDSFEKNTLGSTALNRGYRHTDSGHAEGEMERVTRIERAT